MKVIRNRQFLKTALSKLLGIMAVSALIPSTTFADLKFMGVAGTQWYEQPAIFQSFYDVPQNYGASIGYIYASDGRLCFSTKYALNGRLTYRVHPYAYFLDNRYQTIDSYTPSLKAPLNVEFQIEQQGIAYTGRDGTTTVVPLRSTPVTFKSLERGYGNEGVGTYDVGWLPSAPLPDRLRPNDQLAEIRFLTRGDFVITATEACTGNLGTSEKALNKLSNLHLYVRYRITADGQVVSNQQLIPQY